MDILRKTGAESSHFIHRTVLKALPVLIRNTRAITSHANEGQVDNRFLSPAEVLSVRGLERSK